MAMFDDPQKFPPIEPQVRPLEPLRRPPTVKDDIGHLAVEILKLRTEVYNLKKRIEALEKRGDDDHAGQAL